jgi:DNA-binding Lrp family transcriptional regulator
MGAKRVRATNPLFGYVGTERLLGLIALSGPISYADIDRSLGKHPGGSYYGVQRLVRAGVLRAERLGVRKALVTLNEDAVGSEALRALIAAVAPWPTPPRKHAPERTLPARGPAKPMDLDALFGSSIGGRALMLIRALGGADALELCDLLAKRERKLVVPAMRRFASVGAVKMAPRAADSRKPYVLASDWTGAEPLRRLLDAHLDAMPEVRRRAALSVRSVGGRRGQAPPPRERVAPPPGLAAAPFFAPFLPPAQAKVVLLIAKHGPVTTAEIATALNIHPNAAHQVSTATAKRGFTTTAVSTKGSRAERWYSLATPGTLFGGYLDLVCGSVPAPRRPRHPPPFPPSPSTPWRRSAAPPGSRQRAIVGLLDALVEGPQSFHALARAMGKQTSEIKPHLDKLARAGIVTLAFPANVRTYAFDKRTKQGRAAFALFSTP